MFLTMTNNYVHTHLRHTHTSFYTRAHSFKQQLWENVRLWPSHYDIMTVTLWLSYYDRHIIRHNCVCFKLTLTNKKILRCKIGAVAAVACVTSREQCIEARVTLVWIYARSVLLWWTYVGLLPHYTRLSIYVRSTHFFDMTKNALNSP